MRLKAKGLALTIAILTIVATVLTVYSLPTQSYLDGKRGSYSDQHVYRYIEAPDAQLAALLTHEVDAAGVPTPENIRELLDHGFTLTQMEQIGYTMTFDNNRVWPFGVSMADVNDPWFTTVRDFRKGLHRLLDVDLVVSQIYTDPDTGISTMTKCERYMPPSMSKWIPQGQAYGPNGIHTAEDLYAAPFDPAAAATYFDNAGFTQGSTPNPDYDPNFPGSAQYMRVDPKNGGDLHFEYYAIGPDESPLGYAMAEMFSLNFKKAGLSHDLVAGTWLGMVIRLVNPDLEDFQFMTGVGVVWGVTSPDQWRDFSYSEDIPLWNFALMNFSQPADQPYCTDPPVGEKDMDADYWGEQMMATLDEEEVKHAAFEIAEVFSTHEPYKPLLLWQNFAVTAGAEDPEVPSYEGPGGYRIVNMNGQGIGNAWNRQRTYAGRTIPTTPPTKINLWIYGAKLSSQNPLEADTSPDWGCIMGNVYDGHYRITPFRRTEWWTGAVKKYTTELWIGPGSSKAVSGDGVYNAAVTYDGNGKLLTYGGKAIADVTAADLQGDDKLGMITTWKLRNDMYWHDSDPGPDGQYGTDDDHWTFPGNNTHGKTFPVTTADVHYMARIMLGNATASYENTRYYGTWNHFAGYVWPRDGPFAVEIVDSQTYKLYEERRFVFAYQFHDILLLGAKHIWEPYINGGGDPNTWEGYDRTKATVNTNLLDPVRKRLGLSDMYLTDQIGFGPFVYHHGGWEKGVSTTIEVNPLYYAGNSHPGPPDVDLEGYYNPTLPEGKQYYGLIDAADYKIIIDARDNNPDGWGGDKPYDPMMDPTGDLVLPSQIVDITEVQLWADNIDVKWGAGYDQ